MTSRRLVILVFMGITLSVASLTNALADSALAEDTIHLISIEKAEDSSLPGGLSSFKAEAGKYSYKIYLPPSYHEESKKRAFPALFVMSPGGNPGMGAFKKRARDEGWIVVMYVEAKNGPWPVILGNMEAAHSDVIKRFRVLNGYKFATGFSGGARGSSLFSQSTPGFGGVLLQGAGFASDDSGRFATSELSTNNPYSVFMVMGDKDSNYEEVAKMKTSLPNKVKFESLLFQGGHVTAPEEHFIKGINWLVAQTLPATGAISADVLPFALQHFDYRLGELNEAGLTFSNYTEGQSIMQLAKQLNLQVDPVRKPKVLSLFEQITVISKDPKLQLEINSEKAYAVLEKRLEKTLEEMASPDERKKERAQKQVKSAYVKFAEQYSDTAAAKKAQAAADEIKE